MAPSMRVWPPQTRTRMSRKHPSGGASSMGLSHMRERIPWALRAPVRSARNALTLRRVLAEQELRWAEIAATPPRSDGVAVSYGYEQMPTPDEVVYGGHV